MDVVQRDPHSDLLLLGHEEKLFHAVPANWRQPVDESFRLLALNVQRLMEHTPNRTLVVMSAFGGDGRSRTAAALAQTLCELDGPVALIDADPFGSGTGTPMHALGPPRVPPGLASASTNGNGTGLGLDPLQSPLWLVYHNRERVGRRRDFREDVQRAVAEAHRHNMTVLMDTPACNQSSLAFHFASQATGVIYVARPDHSSSALAVHRNLRAQLELLGASVLGLVINEF